MKILRHIQSILPKYFHKAVCILIFIDLSTMNNEIKINQNRKNSRSFRNSRLKVILFLLDHNRKKISF